MEVVKMRRDRVLVLALVLTCSWFLSGCGTDGGGGAFLIIQNEASSGATITGVYIRQSFAGQDWGSNRLDGSSILPNYERVFEIAAGFQYDFKCDTTGSYQLDYGPVTFAEGRHEQWTLTSTGWGSYHWY
jgi:predicted small secreted protein